MPEMITEIAVFLLGCLSILFALFLWFIAPEILTIRYYERKGKKYTSHTRYNPLRLGAAKLNFWEYIQLFSVLFLSVIFFGIGVSCIW
jgi:hypothetical protein